MTRTTPFFVALFVAALPAGAWAQGGIQYDKIEIKTDKIAPNLYMLSGSEDVDPGHPGRRRRPHRRARRPRRHLHGRFAVPADRRQGARGGQAHRSGTDPLPRQHAHPRRSHRRQRDVREAGRGAARARGAARRDGAPAAADAAGAPPRDPAQAAGRDLWHGRSGEVPDERRNRRVDSRSRRAYRRRHDRSGS